MEGDGYALAAADGVPVGGSGENVRLEMARLVGPQGEAVGIAMDATRKEMRL